MSARARAALAALLGALLLASLAAAPGGAATAPGDANVTYDVQLQADGDARWTVRAEFTLDSAAERAAFADLADTYERGGTRALGLEAFRNASREASLVTGREMRITDPTRAAAPDSAIENGTGWLSLSFTWTNFARVTENDDLVVGDAFRTRQGTWLSRLGDNETLIITPPDSHNPFDGDCILAERSFRCEGPRTLEPGTPHVEFAADGAAGPADLVRPAALVAGLAALLVIVYLAASRRDALPTPEGPIGGGADEGEEPPAGGDAEPDLELLSDEERVERLLEQNGGRMKQASIVKETGWSNAKVSQLLSTMAEEGRVDKLRIGRENLISFPDEDVADLDE